MSQGRPSGYSDEIADSICEQLTKGLSLRKICAQDNMPAVSMVFRWLAQHEIFREQYARAREAQAEALADEIIDIADDNVSDTYIDDDGRERTNHDAINRSRLRVDARKWVASKLLPKKYGEKVTTEHAGNVQIATITRTIIDNSAANTTDIERIEVDSESSNCVGVTLTNSESVQD